MDLVQKYERLKNENTHLFLENQKLMEIIKNKDIEIKNYKEKIEMLKLGEAFLITSEGQSYSEKRNEAKQKINKLIKEIDRCLTLLNE